MEQKCQIGEIRRGSGTGANKASNLIHPPHDPLIEYVVVSHGVVNPLGALDQPGKNVIEVIDRESVVQP